jgi:hypothetical protein
MLPIKSGSGGREFAPSSLRGAKRRSNPGRRYSLDCFASLAMTSRSRDASSHPSYAKPVSKVVTTALDAVLHAEPRQANAGGSIGKRRFRMDDGRIRTKERKKEKRKYRRRNADRGKALLPWRFGHGRASQRGGAHLSAFHHGSRPKESFIGKGRSLRPGFLGRGGQGSVL